MSIGVLDDSLQSSMPYKTQDINITNNFNVNMIVAFTPT